MKQKLNVWEILKSKYPKIRLNWKILATKAPMERLKTK